MTRAQQDTPGIRGQIIAAIDIGTNSVLLTIAREEPQGAFTVLRQLATVTRLGQDVDRTGALHPDAEERTLACLLEYKREMDEHAVTRACAVGTSALRDARGGAPFLARATQVLGFAPEVVSGEREAELTFIGALSGLSDPGRAFVFDIGGGSTELIVGQNESTGAPRYIEQCVSLNLGSVRLTERHQLADPPTAEQLLAIRAEICRSLEQCGIVGTRGLSVVGVAGTVTTLAALAQKMRHYDGALIHGASLALTKVSELVTYLASLRLAERRALPGLSKGRADVIVAGSLLCEEILKWAGADSLTVSDRGVRFGLLAELTRK